ncbi:MAG: Bacterial type II secretion system protein F domain protein [Syntrophus sp. PtaB.Bin001]|nr:MAG: Bacterial type II secretion system protein F domain protein [Syntrophus sp. PtaB.Bin001]
MDILPVVIIFVAAVVLIEGIFLFFSMLSRIRNPEKRRIAQQLRTLSRQRDRLFAGSIDITKKKKELSSIPWLDRVLSRVRRLLPSERLMEQAGSTHPIGVFVLSSVVLFVTGILVFNLLTKTLFIALPAGVSMASLPFLYLKFKKSRRTKKFGEQLPDALDLIARSLKAGHAFPGGLQMVAREFKDPLGGEFAKVVDEINFGLGIDESLHNLTERVDSPDLKFFAIAALIQRESGGNLAEILESIARIIRERFKLQGTIKTLSAEGRLSAIILVALPFFVAFALSIVNPKYITVLTTDSIGKTLVLIALIMMIAGIFVIKKTVQIKV